MRSSKSRGSPPLNRAFVLLHSEAFADGAASLRVAEEHGLESIVSKRRHAPYRSGACRVWRKVKTQAWREANKERWGAAILAMFPCGDSAVIKELSGGSEGNVRVGRW